MAGLRCTVCTHDEVEAIDRAVMQPNASERAIASRYGLNRASLARHRKNHIKRAVERASRAARVAEAQRGAGTLETVEGCVRRALELLAVAEVRDAEGKLTRATDIKGAVSALSAAAKHLGLQAELRGEVNRGAKISVLVDTKGSPRPEWAAVQRLIGEALAELPEGPRALASAAIRRRFAAERAKVGAMVLEADGGPALLESGGT